MQVYHDAIFMKIMCVRRTDKADLLGRSNGVFRLKSVHEEVLGQR